LEPGRWATKRRAWRDATARMKTAKLA
jgi:hypothetical protein